MTPEMLDTIGLILGMTGVLLVPPGLELDGPKIADEMGSHRLRRWCLRILSLCGGLAFMGIGAYLVWSNPQIDGRALAAGGAWCLGLLVGAMLGFFVQETNDWDRKALVSAASVLTGGGIVAILRWAASLGGTTREIWFYPMGLVVGFVIGTIWEHTTFPEKKAEKAETRPKKGAG